MLAVFEGVLQGDVPALTRAGHRALIAPWCGLSPAGWVGG